jgi:hypothetical protein
MTKILVETINGDITRKKRYKIQGNKIIIRKWDKNKNYGYQPTFDKGSIVLYRSLSLFLRRKVYLIDGADRCISFNFEGKLATADIPIWDREGEEKLFEANVVKSAGTITGKIEIPMIFYMLLLGSMMVSFLTLLVSSGRLTI